MEGSYSKVWRARKEVPREEYTFFVEELMGTIRCVTLGCSEWGRMCTDVHWVQARDCLLRGKGIRQSAPERCCNAALL